MGTKSIVEAVNNYGINGLRFFVPARPLRGMVAGSLGIAFTTSSDDPVVVECTIDETRYPIAKNYKITLKPVDPVFASDDFYIMDLENLMRERPNQYMMYLKLS